MEKRQWDHWIWEHMAMARSVLELTRGGCSASDNVVAQGCFLSYAMYRCNNLLRSVELSRLIGYVLGEIEEASKSQE